MPITISPLQPGNVVGPGLLIRWSTDLIGPIGVGWQWFMTIARDAEFSVVAWQFEWTTDGNRGFETFLFGHDGFGLSPGLNVIRDGETAHVRVDLINQGVGEDTGVITGIWDATAGLGAQAEIIARQATGALTPTQAQQLEETHDSVRASFTTATGSVRAVPLDQVVPRPPIEQLGFLVGAFEISGRGELTIPRVAGVPTAYGLALTATTIPSGFGRRDGYVLDYVERLAQLLALRPAVDASGSFVTEALELHLAAFTWFWQFGAIEFIAYDVTPGVVFQCRWVGLLS